MKIFDLRKKDTELIITILNKKIIIKQSDNLYETIFQNWNRNGISRELLFVLTFLYTNPKFWSKKYKKLWLIYLMCLIKYNKHEQAIKVLNMYINNFGYEHIQDFLPVSKFALEQNFSNNSILKSAKLFKLFENNSNELIFNNYIQNKTIAIVGNGRNLIGSNKGEEIDSHDIVIRFNRFEINGYEKDCGSNTNVWVTQTLPNKKTDLNNIDYTILNFQYWNNTINSEHIEDILQNKSNIVFITLEDKKLARTLLKTEFYEPTTGCALILHLYRILGNLDNIDFYGFGFLNDKYKPLDHYYRKVSTRHQKNAQTMHNFAEESQFLKEFVQNKKFS